MKMKTTLLATVAVLCLGSATFMSQAQQLYRIVGPDGKVTFSDQPPPAASNAKITTGRGGTFAESGGSGALPAALRPIVSKYPVTLYTAKDCGPCSSGRSLLSARGVPFTEKLIDSNEDNEAFKRLTGGNTLPVANVGGQQMKGFNEGEWTQYLDAAGYPKESVLPASYRNPAAAPLVVKAAPPAPAASAPPSVKDIAPASGNKGIAF
jgi:glutaredoxin